MPSTTRTERIAVPGERLERIAVHGDLLDFSGEPAWGEVESKAVRFRPDHWLLAEGGRIVRVQAEAPDASWARR